MASANGRSRRKKKKYSDWQDRSGRSEGGRWYLPCFDWQHHKDSRFCTAGWMCNMMDVMVLLVLCNSAGKYLYMRAHTFDVYPCYAFYNGVWADDYQNNLKLSYFKVTDLLLDCRIKAAKKVKLSICHLRWSSLACIGLPSKEDMLFRLWLWDSRGPLYSQFRARWAIKAVSCLCERLDRLIDKEVLPNIVSLLDVSHQTKLRSAAACIYKVLLTPWQSGDEYFYATHSSMFNSDDCSHAYVAHYWVQPDCIVPSCSRGREMQWQRGAQALGV